MGQFRCRVAYSPAGPGHPGNGGAVTVSSNATIVTYAASAAGIFAQSVGGGGGVAGSVGLSPTVGYIGSGGGSGSGGTVAVDMLGGTIATSGDSAHGIFAQSVGGSTANGSPGKGGNVTVNVTGQIQQTRGPTPTASWSRTRARAATARSR